MLSSGELFYEHSQNVIHTGFALNFTIQAVIEDDALAETITAAPRIALQMSFLVCIIQLIFKHRKINFL
jgi:hypothetical protein